MAVLQKIDNPYGMIQTVEHGESFSIYPVSYTHLTLPTNREV